MGRKLEEIRRLRERLSSGQVSGEDAQQVRSVLKSRILGTLLLDARKAAGKSTVDCAMMLHITKQQYEAFETGEAMPTLPQLELLAYSFRVPLSHFWNGNTLSVEQRETAIQAGSPEITLLRRRIMGLRLRQLRQEASVSLDELAGQTGLEVSRLEQIEAGETDSPINEMELLLQAVKGNLDDLSDGYGPVGRWLKSQEDFRAFNDLPNDMREFILKPINRSYLDLAKRLSEMEVEKLRTIAESILDITL